MPVVTLHRWQGPHRVPQHLFRLGWPWLQEALPYCHPRLPPSSETGFLLQVTHDKSDSVSSQGPFRWDSEQSRDSIRAPHSCVLCVKLLAHPPFPHKASWETDHPCLSGILPVSSQGLGDWMSHFLGIESALLPSVAWEKSAHGGGLTGPAGHVLDPSRVPSIQEGRFLVPGILTTQTGEALGWL